MLSLWRVGQEKKSIFTYFSKIIGKNALNLFQSEKGLIDIQSPSDEAPIVLRTPFLKRKVIFKKDKINYKNKDYKYDEIVKLGWYRKVITYYLIFIPIDKYDYAEITIFLDGIKRPIKASQGFHLFLKTKPTLTALEYVTRKSFRTRLKKYTKEFEERNYFTYDNLQFHASSGISDKQ